MDVEALRRQATVRSLRACSAHFVDNDFKLSTVVHESDSTYGRQEKERILQVGPGRTGAWTYSSISLREPVLEVVLEAKVPKAFHTSLETPCAGALDSSLSLP